MDSLFYSSNKSICSYVICGTIFFIALIFAYSVIAEDKDTLLSNEYQNISSSSSSINKSTNINTNMAKPNEIEEDFIEVSKKLRCIVCQNQSLYDSNATIAENLKIEINDMLKQGKTKENIISDMIERYGDAISYDPQKNLANMWLWLLPIVLFLLAGFIIYKQINKDTIK